MFKKYWVLLSFMTIAACSGGYKSGKQSSPGEPPTPLGLSNGAIVLATFDPQLRTGTSGSHPGQIYYSNDQGETWQLVPLKDTEYNNGYFTMLKFLDNQLMFGSHQGVAILNVTSGSWRYVEKYRGSAYGGRGAVYDFIFNQDRFFAATGDGFNISTNAGQSWKNLRQQEFGGGYSPTSAQVQTHRGKIYVATLYDILVSADGGTTWSILPFSGSRFSDFQQNPKLLIQDDFFLAISTAKGIFRSFDAGATWQVLTLPNVTPYREFVSDAAIDGDEIFAWNYMGFYVSSNEGASWRWNPVSSITGSNLDYINHFAVRDGVLVLSTFRYGDDLERVFVSRDRGATWTSISERPGFPSGSVQKIAIY